MTNILPFIKKIETPAFALEKQALSVVLYLKRLQRSGELLHQHTEFEIRDQVMTHLLVTAGVEFDLLEAPSPAPERASIRSITRERYGLALKPGSDGVDAKELLVDWPIDALVQYVLDHEVPVDPRDMPGFEEKRLAG